jgi:hypothetical protein
VIIFLGVFWSLFTLYRIFSLDERNVAIIVLFGRAQWNRLPQLIILATFGIFVGQVFTRKTNLA